MKKRNMTIVAVILVLLLVGVLAQSLVRQKQADRVVVSIRKSVAQSDNKQKALELAFKKYKDDIEFVRTHRPIIRIGLQTTSAYSCDDLLFFLIYAEALRAEGWEVNTSMILSALDAWECAL